MSYVPPHLLPKVRSEALMQAIEGMPCTLRIASFLHLPCSGRTTVVGCHLGKVPGKGTATKVTDLAAVAGCHTCHRLLDRVDPRIAQIERDYPLELGRRITAALVETHAMLVGAGIITVKNATII